MTKLWTVLVTASLTTLLALFAPTPVARADIFQWEYISPGNPGLGKQASTMLTPDGAGMDAAPGANLSNRDLTKGYLYGVDLSPLIGYDENGSIIGYGRANLSFATLSQADLSFANVSAATLTGANLSGADVRGANFDRYDVYGYSSSYGYGTGLTLAQLTSTASYAAHDLSGTSLGLHNLTGANFTGFNLTDARFAGANLTNVNFTGANLSGAAISGTLTGMNLMNAVVRGATLWGITKAQLYSTASYQANDLSGITLYSDQTGWNFAGKNLSQAQFQFSMNFSNSNFSGANLTDVYLSFINFQNANLSQANLTGANLSLCKLTGANLAGAEVRGANFTRDVGTPASGLSPAQLVSTASYLADDLTGMTLRYNVLTGVNLAGKILTNVDLVGASLEGADLTGADVRGARLERDLSRNVGGITAAQLQSTASYQARDLSGIALGGNNLAGANLAGQNLTNANFESESGYGANLNGANLSQANMTNARFGYSTLVGATLVGANLANLDLHLTEFGNANLAEANLSGSNFAGYAIVVSGDEGGYYYFPGANMAGANLSAASLTNANFAGTKDYLFGSPYPGANLTGANLSGADARGADFQYATLSGANTSNLIQSNGHIAGLDLTAGASLVVRDYDGNPAVAAIMVDQHLATDATGTLRLEFDADHWDSTISFAPGIPVVRGGTLELAFAPGVDVAAQSGRTINLFEWTGVTPTGAFSISSPYLWDLTRLYTMGEVTLTSAAGLLLGDFNDNGVVDAADYVVWRDNFGVQSGALNSSGDGDSDGDVDGADYLVWQRNYGQTIGSSSLSSPLDATVPEPAAVALLFMGMLAMSMGSRAIASFPRRNRARRRYGSAAALKRSSPRPLKCTTNGQERDLHAVATNG